MAHLLCPPGEFLEPHTRICASCDNLCHPVFETTAECLFHCPSIASSHSTMNRSWNHERRRATIQATGISTVEPSRHSDLSRGITLSFVLILTVTALLLTAMMVIFAIRKKIPITQGQQLKRMHIEKGATHPGESSVEYGSLQSNCCCVLFGTNQDAGAIPAKDMRHQKTPIDESVNRCACCFWPPCCLHRREELQPTDSTRTCNTLVSGEATPLTSADNVHEMFLMVRDEKLQDSGRSFSARFSILPQQETCQEDTHTVDKTHDLDSSINSRISPTEDAQELSDSGKGSSAGSSSVVQDTTPTDSGQVSWNPSAYHQRRSMHHGPFVTSNPPKTHAMVHGRMSVTNNCASLIDLASSAVCRPNARLRDDYETVATKSYVVPGTNRQYTCTTQSGYDGSNDGSSTHLNLIGSATGVVYNGMSLHEDATEPKGVREEFTAGDTDGESLVIDLRTGPGGASMPFPEVVSLASDTTDPDDVWNKVMGVYQLVEGQLHRFPWVVGCMVSSDVIEVVANLSETGLTVETGYDRLCEVVPQDLRQYMLFTVEAPSIEV